MSLESSLAAVDVVAVNEAELGAFTRESQHFRIAFNLFRETAGYVCILANITVGPTQAWNIEQAVLGGHLIRMFKLMRFAMEESIKRRGEMLSVLIRLLAECVINVRYLILHDSPELIRSYLIYSLQHEKDLGTRIRTKIDNRGGEVLPIEERMLRSITKAFAKSLLLEEELPEKKIRNWGDKSLFDKASAVGLGDAYIAIFGAPSRNVHGGWHDLLQYHLECDEPGVFRPKMKFTRPRPQPIYSLTALIAETLKCYVDSLNHPELQIVAHRLRDLNKRNYAASEAHECYLVSKNAG